MNMDMNMEMNMEMKIGIESKIKLINIPVSIGYNNEKLSLYLEKDDLLLNESILNYGIIMYDNQSNFINETFEESKEKIYMEKKMEIESLKERYIGREIENEKRFEGILAEMREKNICDMQKMRREYESKIGALENDMERMINEKTLDITTLIDKGKSITKEDYDKIVGLHVAMNAEMKKTYEKQLAEMNEKNERMRENIAELNEKILEMSKMGENGRFDAINGNIGVLNDKVSNLFDKIFKGNTEKGIFGENFIENYLADKFSNGKIIDTHKETAKGDMLFLFDKSKMLIESKNVQVLKKDDTDKFYRDIEYRVAKGEINSALLISLNDTNLVNGKRHFHFEVKSNIPVIMVSNVFNNTEFIRFSILTLNYLIKFGIGNFDGGGKEASGNDEKMSIVVQGINETFGGFKSQMAYLQNDKQLLQKMEESYRKRENEMMNVEKIYKNIFFKFPELAFSGEDVCDGNTKKKMKKNVGENVVKKGDCEGGISDGILVGDEEINDGELVNEETFNMVIEKIKNKLKEDPSFVITGKNLLQLDISNSTVRKVGGMKKITDVINLYKTSIEKEKEKDKEKDKEKNRNNLFEIFDRTKNNIVLK